MRATRTLFLLASLLALALFAAGCGGDDGGDPKSKSSKSSTSSTSDSDEPADAPEGAEDSPVLDPDDKGSEDATFQIQVKDGKVIGGPQSMPVSAGDKVRIEILSDAEDEVHVHGIDKEAEVPKGRPAVLEFTVKDPGSYELEFHENGLVLGTVNAT